MLAIISRPMNRENEKRLEFLICPVLPLRAAAPALQQSRVLGSTNGHHA